MAGDIIQEYAIEIGFKKALNNLRKMKTASQAMNKMNESSLSRQINLQKRLNALSKAGVGGVGRKVVGTTPAQARSSTAAKPSQNLAAKMKTEFANQSKMNKSYFKEKAKNYLLVEKELKRQQAKKDKRELDLAKIEYKRRLKVEKEQQKLSNLKVKEAVAKITQPSGFKPKDVQKLREKPAKLQDSHVKARGKAAARAAKEKAALQREINKLLETERLIISSVLTKEEKIVGEKIKQAAKDAKSVSHLKILVAQEKQRLYDQKKSTKELRKQNFLMQRLSSSSKQYAGNMVSAFAITAGATGATKIGQDFEATAIAIETASGSAEAGAENLKFLRQQAKRLGIDYTKSAKGLSQLLAAGEGVLPQEDLRNVFLGVSEASTVMGLSADDTAGAIRAIHQMMSKSKISAEELRQQLGERMSPSFKLMAKAVGVTTEELDKMMAAGKLFAKDVLPEFGKNLREFAAPGLDKALKTNRVAMNRFTNEIKFASEAFFKGGFGEGLTDVFNAMRKMLSDSVGLWKFLGKVTGAVLKGIAITMKNVTGPVITAIGRILETVGDVFSSLADRILPQVVDNIGLIKIALIGVMAVIRPLTTSFLAILALLEEIVLFFKPQEGVKTFLGYNIDDITKPYEDLKKDIQGIFPDEMRVSLQKVNASIEKGALLPASQSLSKDVPWYNPSPSFPPINISTSVTLEAEGETLAQVITPTNTFNSAVERTVDSKGG